MRREPDLVDARRLTLRLTESGRAAYDAIMPMFVEGEARLIGCLDPAERATLERLLDKVCRAVPGWVR